MRALRKKVGDIYLNPLFGDLWVLNKIWNDEEKKDVWTLNLVNHDCREQLKYVDKFVKLGNIYDLVEKKLKKEARKKCDD